MEFLGVGYQELLLVLVLMLVVVGPERLPQVAYQIGRAVRQMQRYARTVRDEFSDEFGFIEEQYKVVRGEVDVARTEFRRQQQELNAEVNVATKEIESAVPDELKGRGNVIPLAEASANRNPTYAASEPGPAQAAVTPEPQPEPASPANPDRPPLLF